jgi:hypothetical protein
VVGLPKSAQSVLGPPDPVTAYARISNPIAQALAVEFSPVAAIPDLDLAIIACRGRCRCRQLASLLWRLVLPSKYEVRRVHCAGITKADERDTVVGVERDLGVSAQAGAHHLDQTMDAIGAHVDLVVIALAKIEDVVVAAAGREDEGIGAGDHAAGRRRG